LRVNEELKEKKKFPKLSLPLTKLSAYYIGKEGFFL
jgi:hypothetical protein